MDHTTYCYRALKDMLKTDHFQLWQYNDYTDETTFICGDETLAEEPTFPEYSLNRPTHRYKLKNHIQTIFFLYPQGYQMGVSTSAKTPMLNENKVYELLHILHLLILEQTVNKKNTELTTIVDSMHSITSISELDNVLESIINYALNVIPASDAGYLMLYNEEKERLITRVAVGFSKKIFQFQTRIGESITGSVFQDGKGRIFNSRKALFKRMDTLEISEHNLKMINDSAPFVEGAICVPIKIGSNPIGVIIIHQRKMKRRLTNHDLYLLEAFAGQAGIAIQNAQFHEDTTNRLNEITLLSDQLKQKNDLLRQRYDIHERLTNVSLKNRGIDVLINELEKLINQPLAFFNNLEYSFYAPTKSSAEDLLTIFEIKTLFKDNHLPTHIKVVDDVIGERHIYLQPVYTSGLFLGCLMLDNVNHMTRSERTTLEQGSTALALELVNRKTSASNHQQQLYEQFRDLMTSADSKEIIEYSSEIGLSTTSYCLVAIFEVPQSFNDIEYIDFDVYQLTAQIDRALQGEEFVIYSFYNEIIVLTSIDTKNDVKYVQEKLLSVQNTRDKHHGSKIRGGVSNAYEGIEHMKVCYEEARKALSYLTNRDQLNIIHYKDIGLNRLFVHQSTTEISTFINEVFAPLQTDSSRHKELEETLIMYINNNRSAKKTAQLLHIHINTLYQRLKNIEELLDVDLNNSEDNLEIQLACHLQSTRRLQN